MSALWIILTACAVSGTGALLGSLMIMRRLTMIADAVSHAVLPGIVLGFWLEGDLNSPLLLLGAGFSGLAASFGIDYIRQVFKLPGDASTGLIFTFLFSVGVIMIAQTKNVDLDTDCVLFGEIAFVPLDILSFGGISFGAKAFWTSAFLMFFSYAAFHLFYERIKAVTFDENFCKTTGINFVAWHYRLMAMVSFFSVASFSSVGLILVLTFLVIPAASSFLFAKTLRGMVYLGFFIGIINSVSGYYLAAWTDTSVSGAIAVVSGVVFFIGLTLKNILSRRVSNNTYEPLTQN